MVPSLESRVMGEKFVNNVVTTLDGDITDSDTTIPVASAAALPSSGDFRILIRADGVNDDEICLVRAVSGNDLTVERAAESIGGTQAASAHLDESSIEVVLTAESVRKATPGAYKIFLSQNFR